MGNVMHWRKSSHSGNGGADCVELARTPREVAARDSKNPHGAILKFSPEAFGAFLSDIKSGKYDHRH
ncbi:DUF397 domain-containing protein [Thermomonospora curvata]|uniref:DUF397 domain-containing protein n=1 Tax=Thermomonospora curvata (strain ATCC 19995 / DSM 43183 / JCM 3096 / KCTC 9072 / NBRC 15933 / NCIMB 10081 / Henssen B9) TaxID=471852 RepID=D1AA57_THECD|nr:DUF397 domain-containing protein [Thermomonospora curvata]ACY96993.1 protein of unknown function DUF397 [Thermomonospora curvata DSM 43183]